MLKSYRRAELGPKGSGGLFVFIRQTDVQRHLNPGEVKVNATKVKKTNI